jgi:nucleotide-binding universal stress UspA family protein
MSVARRIAVPVTLSDRSRRAFDVAAELAAALHAELLLVGISPVSEDAEQQELADRLVIERVDELAALAPEGAFVRQTLDWGSAGEALLEAARDEKADLLVVPMERGGEVHHLVHDTADRHVLHRSDVPVLVVPSGEPEGEDG